MPNIIFDKVTAFYTNQREKTTALVLEDFSCKFLSNKVTSIVGESGCGKTTLLKCICDTVSYDGAIYFDDKNVDTINIKDKNISYMSQIIDLLPNNSVFENIISPLLYKKVPDFEARKIVYEIAEEFNFSFALARKVKELSIGQQRLVSFMKAVIKCPSVLLLDEPLSGLDKDSKNFLMENLKKYFNDHDTTVIVVTHEIEAALKYSDQVYVMNDGKIVSTGSPEEIFKCTIPLVRELIHAERESI